MVVNSSTKIPIELENSERLIIWPHLGINECIIESNLIALLREAYSKNLSTKQKIIAYKRVRNPKYSVSDDAEFYINKKISLSYEQLNNLYRTLRYVREDYSPEAERKRHKLLTIDF